MVRAAAIVLLLATAACDDLPASKNSDRIMDVMAANARQDMEIVELRAEVRRLKEENENLRTLLDATSALASATSEAHEGLRNTVNSNVDIDNKRANTAARDIANIKWRLGIQ